MEHKSDLALLLVSLVTLGHMSSPMAHDIAVAARKDIDKVAPPTTTFPLLYSLCSSDKKMLSGLS